MFDGSPPDSPIKVSPEVIANVNNKSMSFMNRLRNKKIRKNKAIKEKLDLEDKNTSEVRHYKTKLVGKGAVAGLIGFGGFVYHTGSKAADLASNITGTAVDIVKEAREIATSIIDKREVFLKFGFITPEDVLNFSYEELLDIMLTKEFVTMGNIAGEIVGQVGEVASDIIEGVSER